MSNEADEIEQLLQAAAQGGVYLARERIGTCQVCGREDDLRFGCCFDCADHVKATELVRLWDERHPENTWFCDESGKVLDLYKPQAFRDALFPDAAKTERKP